MPRPLVLGNGSLLLAYDDRYALRDLYWPHVGFPNHLNGHAIRTGVWVDGAFAWCDADDWNRRLGYVPGTLVGKSVLTNRQLGLEIEVTEAVDPQSAEYVRRMDVRNLTNVRRDVRIFFTHDLRLAQSDVGDTALYQPFLDAIVHYKGPHCLAFTGETARGGLIGYATGIKAFGGFEGTWRDAEDGVLSMNPISQGSVDSTFGIGLDLPGGGEAEAWYAMVAAPRLDDAGDRLAALRARGYGSVLQEAERYWSAWLDRAERPGLAALPERVQALFFQSLLIMRTQVDNDGAILAANDTDIMQTNRATYSYVWPRDGARVSTVFDQLGYRQIAQRFFDFCRRVLPHDRPALMQKYRPDGSLGASWHPWVFDGVTEIPFQEDETALTVSSMAAYHDTHQETEVLGDLWEPFIRPTSDFMLAHRGPEGLPRPSWDLWEERRGVHFYTVTTVLDALRDAARIAAVMGDTEREGQYRQALELMFSALQEHLWDEREGRYWRRLRVTESGAFEPDPIPDASVLAGLASPAFDAADERVRRAVAFVEEHLTVRSAIGGLARYDGDYYFRRSDRYPGNPWIICTLWLAQAKLRAGDQAAARSALEWVCNRAASTGVLPEQVHPDTGEPLSVSPLTWSHAEYVATVTDLLTRVDLSFRGMTE